MKNYFRRLGTLLLPAILLLACSLSLPFSLPGLPGSKQAPAKVALHLAPDTLADPTLGLADLKSYHVSFHQDVIGRKDGKPYEHHTHIELTRASGAIDFMRELQSTDRSDSYFRAIQAIQAVYRWNSINDSCQGEEGTLRVGEVLDPAELLLPVLKTAKAGMETVNQISSIHYRFDQNALPLTDPKPTATGDMWLAENGGYLVKYTLSAQSSGNGMEGTESWTYELSRVNAVDALAMPKGCSPVPVDIPAMSDAQNIRRHSGLMSYQTGSSITQVVDFYFQQMVLLGWTTNAHKPAGELKVPFGLTFDKGGELLTIVVDTAEGGGLDVTITEYNPKERAEIAASQPTSTPSVTVRPTGPQPTIDPSKSGLPSDIPLYPGATNLRNMGGQGIAFDAPDQLDQVAAFYRQHMAAGGWKSITDMQDGTSLVQVWQKAGRMVSLQISLKDGKTTVILMQSNTP
jgi:hypothetical protein